MSNLATSNCFGNKQSEISETDGYQVLVWIEPIIAGGKVTSPESAFHTLHR